MKILLTAYDPAVLCSLARSPIRRTSDDDAFDLEEAFELFGISPDAAPAQQIA